MSVILLATEKAFAKDAVDKIRKLISDADHTLELLEAYSDKQMLIDVVKDVDALIVRSDIVDKAVLEAAARLKIVVRAGAGYDNIDLQTAAVKKIVVMNTPGQNANAVAECAFGMMIYQSRKQFSGASGTELRGKKLGIIGYGNIGKYMAQIAKGFGMDILAYKKHPNAVGMRADGVIPVETFEEIFSSCDFVSLHIPAAHDTREAINYNLLNKLPVGAMLVNTARQEVLNEYDLIRIMEERPDISYVTDFIPKNEADFKQKFAKRYFAPPKKMGAQTEEANINAGIAAAKQILNFLDKGDVTFKVN